MPFRAFTAAEVYETIGLAKSCDTSPHKFYATSHKLIALHIRLRKISAKFALGKVAMNHHDTKNLRQTCLSAGMAETGL